MQNELRIKATENFEKFTQNSYPGRVIVLGTSEDGNSIIQLYAITGRSPESKNRFFQVNENFGELKTEVADLELMKGKDTSLLIYKAMAQNGYGCYAVSNGVQTDDVLYYGATPQGINQAAFLSRYQYEPDAPNFTPRISAVTLLRPNRFPMHRISLLRKDLNSDICSPSEHFFSEFCPGVGYLVSTYAGDAPSGKKLPSFTGDPYAFPLNGSVENILRTVWDALPLDKRVSLAVKKIDITTGLISEMKAMNIHEPNAVNA